MKSLKLGLTAFVLFMSVAAFSQTDTSKSATTTTDTATTKEATTSGNQTITPETSKQPSSTQSTTTNGTQPSNGTTTTPSSTSTDNNSGSASTSTFAAPPKPNFGRYYIAVLGDYQSSQTDADVKSVKVIPDETNPGKVWVEGLTNEKFYALLKTVPGTYKIPAQTQTDNKIQEGTLSYQEDSKQISICLGCGYDAESPVDVAATNATATPEDANIATTGKAKSKKVSKEKKPVITVINFTGVKTEQGTASVTK